LIPFSRLSRHGGSQAAFFARALNFAHLAFAAAAILFRPFADSLRRFAAAVALFLVAG
jgi:hypothetical protein